MNNKSLFGLNLALFGFLVVFIAILTADYTNQLAPKVVTKDTGKFSNAALQAVVDSTVVIGVGRNIGTAVYLGANKFITAGHVCAAGPTSSALLQKPLTPLPIRVMDLKLANDYPTVDLCLVTSDSVLPVTLKAATLAFSNLGSKLLTGGFSGGRPFSFHIGKSLEIRNFLVSARAYGVLTRPYLEKTTLDIEPGASGSGVFDTAGRLRGVIVLVVPASEGGGAEIVPLSVLHTFLIQENVQFLEK